MALSQFDSGTGEAAFVEKYSYSAFGETQILSPNYELRTTSLYGNPYMFTGREYESETGLYYYRARMYSPAQGRFLQTDPIGYADSMNLYQYCGNNPLGFTDPMGLCKGNAWYKDSWEAVGAFGIGFLEMVYDTEVALLHPINNAKSVWGSMYDMGERFNQTMYDIGANPGMLSDMASDLRDLGGQIAFEELDNATSDPYAWGNAWGKITAGAEMAAIASQAASNTILEGAKGTRIFQLRNAKTGQTIFRLDKGPVPNKGVKLHYHRPPNTRLHRPYQGGF